MKRRNIWGLSSIKKYLRLSTDPGKGSRFAVGDTSTLQSEDAEPVSNADLEKMDNTTFSKRPVQLESRISDHTEHTQLPSQPLCNPPALLPTPAGRNLTAIGVQRGLLPTPVAESSQFSNNQTSSVIHSHSEINNLASSSLHNASDGYCRLPKTSEELMQISDTNVVVNKQQVLPSKSSPLKLTYQQLSDDWKKTKKDILDQNLHKNTDDSSGCELDISPTKPMTSRYCRNLDEYLLSDSENHQPVILSDTDVAQELTVTSQSEVCTPPSLGCASDSNDTDLNKLVDRKNTRVNGPVIDRRKYQIGRGFDDILKIASQNVKRQRRHSLHSSESQKHDGSNHRARHRSNGTPKKKKLLESPKKLPLLVDRSLSESSVKSNNFFIAQDIQKKLDKCSMTLCVPKLDVPDTVSVTEELAVKGFCSCVQTKTERKSLFQSFSNSQHNQPVTKIPEDFNLDIAERKITEWNRDESSANNNICKVSEGVDVDSGSHTTTDCHLDKNRENIGLFDRLRSSVSEISPSKNSPDETMAISPSKDSKPIKTTLKKSINFNLLKEKLSKKTFIRALEKHGMDGSSATTSSKLQTTTLPQSEDEDMMQVSVSDDNHIVNNDDINDPVFDDIAGEVPSEIHVDCKEGTEQLSNTKVLLNDGAASNETRPIMNVENNEDNFVYELISSDDDDDLPDLGDTVNRTGDTANRPEQEQNTKENEVSFSQDSLDDSVLDNSINRFETQPPVRKLKFTLDKMVQNKQDNDLKDVELAKITKELQKDMGVDWMDRAKSEDNENNILPDHKKELDKFACPTDHVPGIYPGDDVFNLDHIGEVFSFPSTLRLVDCGFRPVKGKATDSLLWKASPDDLVGLINSCLLAEAHLVRPCQDALMVWIFYLMSIHGSIHTIMQAFKTLWSLMNNSIRFNQSRVWLPTLKQITRVLLNYGATFESLFPSPDLEPAFSLNDVLNESGKDKENMVEEETESTPKNQSWTSEKQFPVDALNHVIKLITHGMHLREMHKQPVFYSEEELKQLIGLICRAGLETQGKEDTHGEDFALCTAALLEGFSITSWSMKCIELCEALPALTSHHHNLVHLVELFPTFTDRGRQTRRLLSYNALHKLLSEENSTDRVKIEKESLSSDELKVCHLFPLVRSLRPKSDTVYYQLYSMMMLMDMCIGNEPLPSQEKKDIRYLIRDLRSLSSDIRVSPYYPSRSKVKHILERISIKLTLMADNMVSKQDLCSSLSAFFSTPSPISSPNKDSIAQHSRIDSDEELEYEQYHSIVSYEEDLEVKDKQINIKEEIEKDVQVEQNMETESASSHSEKPFFIDRNLEILNRRVEKMEDQVVEENRECGSLIGKVVSLLSDNIIRFINKSEQESKANIRENVVEDQFIKHDISALENKESQMNKEEVLESYQYITGINNGDSTECEAEIQFNDQDASPDFIATSSWSLGQPYINYKEDEMIECINTPSSSPEKKKPYLEENIQNKACVKKHSKKKRSQRMLTFSGHHEEETDIIMTEPSISNTAGVGTCRTSGVGKGIEFNERDLPSECVEYDVDNGHRSHLFLSTSQEFSLCGSKQNPSVGNNNCYVKNYNQKSPSNDSEVILSSLPCSECSSSYSGSIETVLSPDLSYGRSLEQWHSLQNLEEMNSSQESVRSSTSSQCSSVTDIFAVG